MSKPRPWYFIYSMSMHSNYSMKMSCNYSMKLYSIKQSLLFLDWQEEFKFRRQFFLWIEAIWKVNSTNSAISVDGDSKSFDIIASIGSSGEVWEVELDLVPALIEPHRHGADEGLDPCGRLVIGSSEPSSHIFIVEDLHLEGEILLELGDVGCTFLMIMTRKGSLMPRVSFSFWGQVMKAVVTLVPMISRTEDWISWSVSLLMCPLWTT